MFGNSIANKIKALDVYKRVPKGLSQSTISGALISLLSCAFIAFLFLIELNLYLSDKTTTEMNINEGSQDEKLRVNLDITFHSFPCDILSMDIMDVMGQHQVHTGESLMRTRIDKNGKKMEDIQVHLKDSEEKIYDHSKEIDLDRAVKAVNDNEGCQIHGYIYVNKVPGNFHISAHAFHERLHQLAHMTGKGFRYDVGHTVNHLSFGEKNDIIDIRKKFHQGILNPIDGFSTERQIGLFHEYYLKITPTAYVDLNKKTYQSHQFTSDYHAFPIYDRIVAVWFKFDLSPISVTFSKQERNFLHFLVQICAIIGGIFTVAGIIDSILHRSLILILKKAEMGKLS
eukprot:TRINITY_DN4348_c0_g1_i3.p1 TRINITY_DN4348_c0_g1~~TRINITY_DN4348_c0_g1_i3.p1  ORF type:complete len:342 (-),score=38.29 TRINITY_DN4348_c0_g1_i3:85-1110(-)